MDAEETPVETVSESDAVVCFISQGDIVIVGVIVIVFILSDEFEHGGIVMWCGNSLA